MAKGLLQGMKWKDTEHEEKSFGHEILGTWVFSASRGSSGAWREESERQEDKQKGRFWKLREENVGVNTWIKCPHKVTQAAA